MVDFVLVAVGTMLALALLAAVYFLNVRVVVTGDQVTARRMTGREQRWPRSAVQGCLLISVLLAVRPTKLIVVHGPDQKFLFSITADLWDERALRQLTHALGYGHRDTASFRTLTREELMGLYPGSLSFVYRHTWAVGIAGGVLVPLLVIAVGVIIQSALR